MLLNNKEWCTRYLHGSAQGLFDSEHGLAFTTSNEQTVGSDAIWALIWPWDKAATRLENASLIPTMSPLSIWNRVQGLRICRLWSLVALSHLERIRSLAHGVALSLLLLQDSSVFRSC